MRFFHRYGFCLSLLLVVGCGSADGSSGRDSGGDEDGLFGVIERGEVERVGFATTVPDEVEVDPRLVLDVTFFDAETGVMLVGDVVVFKRGGGAGESVSCSQQVRCVMAVRPTGLEDVPWVIEARAVGYEEQVFELRVNTLSSRTMTMPMKLRPIGLDG